MDNSRESGREQEVGCTGRLLFSLPAQLTSRATLLAIVTICWKAGERRTWPISSAGDYVHAVAVPENSLEVSGRGKGKALIDI